MRQGWGVGGEKIAAGSGVQLGWRIKFSCPVEAGPQCLTTVCFKMTRREEFECSWHKETWMPEDDTLV